MPSLKEIAKLANTSVTTVSLVINNRDGAARISPATRKQVLDAARGLGYTPNIAARRLRAGGGTPLPLTIGILLPFDDRLTITIRAVGTIRQALDDWARAERQAAPDLLIETYDGGRLADVRSLADNTRYNGVILFNTLPADDDFLALSGPLPVPVVVVQRTIPDHSWVNVDHFAMGGEVAAHVLGLGRPEIGIVGTDVPGAAQDTRLAGFLAELRARTGVELPPHRLARGAFSETGGYEATRQLLSATRAAGELPPSTLFVTADRIAIGALHALKENGMRIPDDVAVVSYDNDPFGAFADPPLTTVDASVPLSAARAVKLLLDLIRDGHAGPLTALLEARLLIRASCGTNRSAPAPLPQGTEVPR